MRKDPFHKVADCRSRDDSMPAVEQHYGLETLGMYGGCEISGSCRYEIQPKPRVIYQAYAFKGKALLFVQVLQTPIPKTGGQDPPQVKRTLSRLALQAIIERIDTGDFEVGEQYDTLLPNAWERASCKPRGRGAAFNFPRDDRDSISELERRGKTDTDYATS